MLFCVCNANCNYLPNINTNTSIIKLNTVILFIKIERPKFLGRKLKITHLIIYTLTLNDKFVQKKIMLYFAIIIYVLHKALSLAHHAQDLGCNPFIIGRHNCMFFYFFNCFTYFLLKNIFHT